MTLGPAILALALFELGSSERSNTRVLRHVWSRAAVLLRAPMVHGAYSLYPVAPGVWEAGGLVVSVAHGSFCGTAGGRIQSRHRLSRVDHRRAASLSAL